MKNKYSLPIRNYADGKYLVATARTRNGKPLGSNARLIPLANGDFALRYCYTNIVTWHRDDTFTLNHDGWMTRSTRVWMEAATGISIREVDGEWEIRLSDVWTPYCNGMTIDPKQTALT